MFYLFLSLKQIGINKDTLTLVLMKTFWILIIIRYWFRQTSVWLRVFSVVFCVTFFNWRSSQQAARNLRSPIRIFLFFCPLTPLQASGNALAGIQLWFAFDSETNRARVSSIIEGYNYDIHLLCRLADTADTSLSVTDSSKKGCCRAKE